MSSMDVEIRKSKLERRKSKLERRKSKLEIRNMNNRIKTLETVMAPIILTSIVDNFIQRVLPSSRAGDLLAQVEKKQKMAQEKLNQAMVKFFNTDIYGSEFFRDHIINIRKERNKSLHGKVTFSKNDCLEVIEGISSSKIKTFFQIIYDEKSLTRKFNTVQKRIREDDSDSVIEKRPMRKRKL